MQVKTLIWQHKKHIKNSFQDEQDWFKCRNLKGPTLKSSVLYISAFKDRPDRGAFNMFEKYV